MAVSERQTSSRSPWWVAMVALAVVLVSSCESKPERSPVTTKVEATGVDETTKAEPPSEPDEPPSEPDEPRDRGFVDVSQYMEPVEPREKRLAVNALSLCEIDAQGVLRCMGEFWTRRMRDKLTLESMSVIEGLPPLRYVDSAGGVCGLDEGGLLHCFGAPFWKDNRNSPFKAPLEPLSFPDFGRAVAVEMWWGGGCLLRADGHVDCFGDTLNYERITPAAPPGYDPSTTVRRVPELRARAISCADYYCCAVTADERGVCWGGDSSGELGRSKFEFTDSTPEAVHGLPERIRAIGAGHLHGCALDSQGEVYCWGFRGDLLGPFERWLERGGLPADGEFVVRQIEKGVKTRWLQLDPGEFGADYCEYDDRVQSGVSAVNRWPCSLTAQRVEGLPRALEIAVGYLHACALTVDREVYCWGTGRDGELGIGANPRSAGPTRVDIDGVDALTAQSGSTCAVKGNELWCWGRSPAGSHRDGKRDLNSPERVLPR